MTANDLLRRLLKDPILIKQYKLTQDSLRQTEFHKTSDSDIVEIMKLIVLGIEEGTPDRSIYSQIKTHFKL
jgi:hypothetical protein